MNKGPLARASFDLHAELAAELGADAIGYRRLSCIGPYLEEIFCAVSQFAKDTSSRSLNLVFHLNSAESEVRTQLRGVTGHIRLKQAFRICSVSDSKLHMP